MRYDSRQLPEKPDIGIVVRAAIEDVEPGSPFGPGLFGSVLRRQTYQARGLDAQRGFVVLVSTLITRERCTLHPASRARSSSMPLSTVRE